MIVKGTGAEIALIIIVPGVEIAMIVDVPCIKIGEYRIQTYLSSDFFPQ